MSGWAMRGQVAMGEARREDVERGRRAYDQKLWADAFDAFDAFDGAVDSAPLGPEDLYRLAMSSALLGRGEKFVTTLERLHGTAVEAGDARTAARTAFWIAFFLFSVGAHARASGWLSRTQRHLEGQDESCAEHGYVMLPGAIGMLEAGKFDQAAVAASKAAAVGERCGEPDLVALARHLEARALLRSGRVADGFALLDEVMVAVTAGELSPLVTGIVYCAVIATCQQMYALGRAREWTAALGCWCDEQAQMVNFTDSCMVHRSEILQLGGEWHQAIDQVDKLCTAVEKSAAEVSVLGSASYQRAEILRLRGEIDEAEAAYRIASQNGREPQPGLALLRLAQGRAADAVSTIDRVLATTSERWKRLRLLPPCVEILLAAGHLDRAREASAELDEIAVEFHTDQLAAVAAYARGSVLLASGEPKSAIRSLEQAFAMWHRNQAPYDAARARAQLARAYRELGDNDGADLALEAARTAFKSLGAALDLARLGGESSAGAPADNHGLSPRELEVLKLVARGMTNKQIAAQLFVSERTIDRHVSNIFSKLDISNRSAATAFAYEQGLV